MERTVLIGACVSALACCALGYGTAMRGDARARDANRESAALAALQRPGHLERAATLAPWLATAGPAALRSVTATTETSFQHLGPGPVVMELLCEAWAALDPEGGLGRIRGWPVYFRRQAIPLLLRAWARRDAESAREAALALEGSDDLRREATRAVIVGWAESQPPELWERFVAGQPFGAEDVYEVLRRLAAREGALATLERVTTSLPARGDLPDFEARSLRAAVDLAARQKPEAVAVFVAQRAPEATRPELQTLLARRWAERDGERAMRWLLGRPDDDARGRALRAGLQSWESAAPEAARAWHAEHGAELGVELERRGRERLP